MIESWPESNSEDQSFLHFRELIGQHSAGVRFARVGSTLFVMGTVPTYASKAYIEKEAERLGIQIHNSVRVIPGRDWRQPDGMAVAG